MSTRTRKRALGFVRVSQDAGRSKKRRGDNGESALRSPSVQKTLMQRFADDMGWDLTFLPDEIDVSGNDPLAKRPALSQAVVAVQTDQADVILAAHLDRLWWNVETMAQVLRLVADAGGEVWSADDRVCLTDDDPDAELMRGVKTLAARHPRRKNAQRSRAAVVEAVERGVVPWSSITPGLLRGDDGVCVPDPVLKPVVAQAVEMAASGATVRQVRAFLREHGIERSYHGVQKLLRSPLLVGEIRFGSLVNPHAHEPIVDRATWERAQRTRGTRGRPPKGPPRLLARLGVLRCASCGRPMVGGRGNHGRYAQYACPTVGDCPRRTTISAETVESVVVEAVKDRLRDIEGRASAAADARAAELEAVRAQDAWDAAVRAFDGLGDELSVRERLAELKRERDEKRARAEHLAGASDVLTVTVDDWPSFTHDERRALIRATVERVEVSPGRGPDRVRVKLIGE